MIRCSSQLLRTLEGIAEFVKDYVQKSKLSRLFLSGTKEEYLKKFEDDLDKCLALFSLSLKFNTLSISASSRRVLGSYQDELRTTIDSAQRTQEDLLKASVMKEDVTGGRFPSVLPPAPQIFFGRDELVAEVVDAMTSENAAENSKRTASHVVLLGAGGMGKTSLALTVLHRPKVSSYFGTYRYFVPCESLLDADALVIHLGKRFGIPIPTTISVQARQRHFESHLKRVLSILDKPIIIVLDNFETPWEAASSRPGVEGLLQALVDIPQVNLLLTMRGAERPSGVAWHRPFLAPLPSLDISSAKRTFVSISDVPEDDADLPELLAALENVPLAVTLMANLAQGLNCRDLLQQWREERTSMLTRGWDSRTSSVDVSIQVSLSSERLRSNPSSLPILQILSLLPDGALPEDLVAMSEDPSTVPGAITSLRQVALVQQGTCPQGNFLPRLRSLSPIREFIKAHHPVSVPSFLPVAKHFLTLIESVDIERHVFENVERLRDMRTQMTNLCVVISHGFSQHVLIKDLVRAAINLQLFSDDATPGLIYTLLQTALHASKEISDRELEAACLAPLYENMGAADMKQYLQLLEEALEIYKKENFQSLTSRRDHIRCLRNYGDTWRRIGELYRAREVLQEALTIATSHGFRKEQAELWALLSSIYSELEQMNETREAAYQAIAIAESCSFPLIKGRAYSTLSQLYFKRASFSLSAEFAQKAAEIKLAITGRSHTYAIDIFFMAWIYFRQSRLNLAEQTFREAREIFARCGLKDWMTVVNVAMGKMRLERGDVTGAMTDFHLSFRQWTELSWPREQAACLTAMGEAELIRGNPITAWTHFTEARKLFRAGNECGSTRDAEAMIGLADVAIVQGRPEDAMSHLIVACVIFRKASDRLYLAIIVKKMGDVQLRLREWIVARACYLAAYEVFQHLDVKKSLADVLVSLGDLNAVDGHRAEAKVDWQRALHLYSENPSRVKECEEKIAALDQERAGDFIRNK
ncbi:hypothetical protein SISSUDRAFT_872889 [Sistotremastrum suecicum HHB10207 ss-3]|uniref:Novel STAND NTPase 1 domain-containing protein n=1 Tax=Sistotremastrum suecicum HHB10207 ss-3 TaxID=1314776 RepID=A0A166CCZ9_9AGAM|nr:hypothetical protein SISSUDRAFT_872889 [Sistotremastrum suecicum HHB10207 ss-3]